MAWLAVDNDGTERIFENKPYRATQYWEADYEEDDIISNMISLPKSSIEKLIGKKLTWDDDPVELKKN